MQKPSRRKLLLILLKAGIAFGLLAFLVKGDYLDLDVLFDVQPSLWLAGVLAGMTGMLAFPLLRWPILLKARDFPIGVRDAVQSGMAGCFVSLVMPASIGLDGTKMVWYSRSLAGRLPELFSSMIVDRLVGLLALSSIAGVFGTLLLGARAEELPWKLIVGTAGVIAVLLLGAAITAFRGDFLKRLPGGTIVLKIANAVVQYRHHKFALVQAFGMSLCGHLSAFTAAWCAFHVYGIDAELFKVYAIAPIVNLISALPITPMGLGFADAAAATLYPLVGLERGAESFMLLRGAQILVFVACGIAFLLPSAVSLQEITQQEITQQDAPSEEDVPPTEAL